MCIITVLHYITFRITEINYIENKSHISLPHYTAHELLLYLRNEMKLKSMIRR